MNNNRVFPRTLIDTIKHFADADVAVEFLSKIRWPKGPICPHCGNKKVCFLKTRRVFKCTTRPCRKQFSIKVGTIFEDSAVGLDKWLPVVWMIVNCKNGISSWELHRALGVTQKTAWFMLHRIRLAMQSGTFEKLSGKVEVDETFIGGKARNMHADKRKDIAVGSEVHTDEFSSYEGLSEQYIHEVINHVRSTFGATYTRTAWRTSGACLSVA